MQRRSGEIPEFRNPAPDELSLGILLQRLLDRIIDARGRTQGCPCLHLDLAVMDARFVVEEGAGQMWCKASPIKIQRIGSEGN